MSKLSKLTEQANQIHNMTMKMLDNGLKVNQLASKSNILKRHVKDEGLTQDLLMQAYALMGVATTLIQGKTPYIVQIVGALALNTSTITEMRTGEGKTLTALMPLYANTLSGQGAHLVTANPYLAKRDADEARPVFKALDMTVGYNSEKVKDEVAKKAAYDCDITYVTGSQLGFDYLQDNLVQPGHLVTQRGLHYVLIDEADATLLDNAQTPLIISGSDINVKTNYQEADLFADLVGKDPRKYIKIKRDKKRVLLTQKGIEFAREFYGEDIFQSRRDILHYVSNALTAHFIYEKDVDYTVKWDNQLKSMGVELIDTHTGRINDGQRFNDGMHQALEAKENLIIHLPKQTNASITYQSLFSLYDKVAGMTGTAKTDAKELDAIYNLKVFKVPTNKPVQRKDLPDKLFVYEDDKFKQILKDAKAYHQQGLPLLIVTASVVNSEKLSKMFDEAGLEHETLNANNPEYEAKIVAKAGHEGAITIATNMAGRGTDIKVDKACLAKGGLVVLGAEHHDSIRVDDQLKGRAGRQGQPGITQFYGSFEDAIFEHGKFPDIKVVKKHLKNHHEQLANKYYQKFFTRAQAKLSLASFESKKNDLVYDAIIGQEREVIYAQRRKLWDVDYAYCEFKHWIRDLIDEWFKNHAWMSLPRLIKEINQDLIPNYTNSKILVMLDEVHSHDEAKQQVLDLLFNDLQQKHDSIDGFDGTVRLWILKTLDYYWKHELSYLEDLKRMIIYQGYKQANPYVAYQQEATRSYDVMMQNVKVNTLRIIMQSSMIRVKYNMPQEVQFEMTGA